MSRAPEAMPVADYVVAMKRAGNRTAYRRGAEFERKVMKQLELLGWSCWRSAGSHSPADVVALMNYYQNSLHPQYQRGSLALLVQCKAGSGAMTAQAKQTFIAFARACGATACYADQRQGLGVRIVNLETSEELG